jgi:pseudouridine-5'-phosphate glycosidase
VLGYQTDELPAFYSRQSGLPVDVRVNRPHEVVDIIRARRKLNLQGGMLVTVPVPKADEWPANEAQIIIDQALADADAAGIAGKAVTPYLLERVSTLSGARSKKANIALLLNNARVAAQIAQALVK